MIGMIVSCLKLYSPAIALAIMAGLVPVTGDSTPVLIVRLLVLAVTLALSIHENRRKDERRRERRGRGR